MSNINKNPLVSVIVPIYKVQQYLNKCVDSILAQTYQNLEIILVDDGSPDDCPAICDEYAEKDARIKVIHKPNGGSSDARNVGLDVMKGEYVTFIDGDDYYANDAIEKMVISAVENDVEVVGMGAAIVSSDYSNVKKENPIAETSASDQYFIDICNGIKPDSVCTKMFRASMFENLRFIRNRRNEDFYLLLSMMFGRFKVSTIDYTGYYYYQRPTSATHSTKNVVSDAIKNCIDLMNRAHEERPDLEPYVARMGLHQSSVMVRVLPGEKITRDDPNLCLAYDCIKQASPWIHRAKLKFHEKLIARMTLFAPVLTAKLLRLVRKWIKR